MSFAPFLLHCSQGTSFVAVTSALLPIAEPRLLPLASQHGTVPSQIAQKPSPTRNSTLFGALPNAGPMVVHRTPTAAQSNSVIQRWSRLPHENDGPQLGNLGTVHRAPSPSPAPENRPHADPRSTVQTIDFAPAGLVHILIQFRADSRQLQNSTRSIQFAKARSAAPALLLTAFRNARPNPIAPAPSASPGRASEISLASSDNGESMCFATEVVSAVMAAFMAVCRRRG